MPTQSKFLSGRYLRLLLLHSVWIGSVSLLVGCGANPLSLLTGGGPNVAANTQVGKENTQAVVSQTTQTEAGRDVIQAKVMANEVKEVVVQEVPPWVVLLLVLGWMLPSPTEIARWITSPFKSRAKPRR